MHPVLVRKDFTNFFRNKAAVSLTFLIPFVMIWLFGLVFGVNRKDAGPSGIPVAVVNASTNPAAAKRVDALRAEKTFRIITTTAAPAQRPLTEADLRPLMQAPCARFRFALVIPDDLISDPRPGLHLKFFSNPRSEIETQTVNGLLQKTIFSNVPELLGQSLQARAKKTLGDSNLDRFKGALASAIATAFGGDPADIQRKLSSADFSIADLTKNKPVDPTLRRLDTPRRPLPTPMLRPPVRFPHLSTLNPQLRRHPPPTCFPKSSASTPHRSSAPP